MLKKALSMTLSLMIVSSSAFAKKAGMDRCENEANLQNKYAFILSQTENKKVVSVAAQLPNKTPVYIGRMNVSKVEGLQPWMRQVASGGLVLVGGTALVIGGGVAALGITGASALAFVAPATATALGLSIMSPVAVMGLLDPVNPVAQFENANVEKCLKKQVKKLSQDQENSIILVMNDADDYLDTLGDIKELLIKKK